MLKYVAFAIIMSLHNTGYIIPERGTEMDFARSVKIILCAAVVMSGLFMGSCTGEESSADVALASIAAGDEAGKSYTVRFFAEGEEIAQETLAVGGFPSVPEVQDIPGARFVGWVDSKGRTAVPANTPVTWDFEYTAVFLPILDGEGPYLFTGSGGLLRPDAVLDSTELITALNALAGEAARARFPDSFEADNAITIDELRGVLSCFYTHEEMDRVILGYEDVVKLSRAQFAVIMNGLLGRETDEKVIPAEGVSRIPDVSLTRSDYTELMEAAVEHTHSDSGSVWRGTVLPAMYEEGYVLVEGGLYIADSEGFFITDTVLGTLTFGYDGRYTSGDTALDGYVRAVIADLAESRSYAEPGELLEAAYDYCCDSFSFQRRNTYELGASGWEMSEAITMFESRSGNCCSYAGAFWALARGLGYEARTVYGAIGNARTPHAWVEIDIGGETYIFDPTVETGGVEGIQSGLNMFMLPESSAPAWGYYRGG